MSISRRVLGCAMALCVIAVAGPSACEQSSQMNDMGSGSSDMANPTTICPPPTSFMLPQPQTLSLLAGGLGGPGYLDATGTAARFVDPSHVALDGVGNLYVADRTNKVIRKVVLATGAVTTFAGTYGVSGAADGIGTAAQFETITGILADSSGNLYVSDARSSTIRKVVLATAAVSTIAGTAYMTGSADGIGSAARFLAPGGLALDSSGNLYIADGSARTIRKMVLSSGTVTTIAGSSGMIGSFDGIGTNALFGGPHGLSLDGNGNLFVADRGNNNIRKIVLSSGAVTTLAGMAGMTGGADGTGASARFNSPMDVAADRNGNLYVSDSANGTIRKVVVATGAVSTLAGMALYRGSSDGTGAAANFNALEGLALDGSGNLYVADSGNQAVRRVVTSTGVVTTIAGSARHNGNTDGTGASARFTGPGFMVPDGCGNLYVSDSDNYAIRKVVAATGTVTTVAGTAFLAGSTDGTGTDARFNTPAGLALDPFGNLYVADYRNHTIRKVTLSTGAVSTVAGMAGMKGSADGTGTAARFGFPNGLALDSSSNLYVADGDNSTIRKMSLASGAVTTLAGLAGVPGSVDGTGSAARFSYPCALAMEGSVNLYVADCRDNTIRKVVLATGTVTTLAGMSGAKGSTDGTGAAARFNTPAGLGLDGNGNLYVADYLNATLRKVSLPSGAVTTVAGVVGSLGVKLGPLPAGLRGPAAVTVLPTGDIVVSDSNEGAILVAR